MDSVVLLIWLGKYGCTYGKHTKNGYINVFKQEKFQVFLPSNDAIKCFAIIDIGMWITNVLRTFKLFLNIVFHYLSFEFEGIN